MKLLKLVWHRDLHALQHQLSGLLRRYPDLRPWISLTYDLTTRRTIMSCDTAKLEQRAYDLQREVTAAELRELSADRSRLADADYLGKRKASCDDYRCNSVDTLWRGSA